jgi:hypothetical protein
MFIYLFIYLFPTRIEFFEGWALSVLFIIAPPALEAKKL